MHASKNQLRTVRVVLYMTVEDADHLTRLAENLGFKGRATLIVSIMERLIVGGWSLATWFRTGAHIMRLIQKANLPVELDLFPARRPAFALSPDHDPSRQELVKALAALKPALKLSEA